MFASALYGVASALTVASATGATEPKLPELKFEKYTLPNGLTVILSEDHRLPQVAVDIWYHVGAANQVPGKSGFAHLFEHMMFSGAKHIGPQPFKILEGIGTAAGAMANGTTNFDRTNYFEVVPSSELPTALWLESDRMAFLLDTLDEKKLKVQRDVVSNERRQSYENRPYGTANLAMCDALYPKPHPYYNCVIGTVEEIQSASMDDLKGFFRSYYTPNNSSLALVGDFKSGEAKALVEKYFGAIPRGPEVTRPDVPAPVFDKEVEEKIADSNISAPRLMLVWHGVKTLSEDEAAGDLLGAILGQGKTSRLYRALVFDKQVAADTDADNQGLGLGGSFEVTATANQTHTVAELRPLVQAILDEVRKNGVTPEELERAKRLVFAGRVRTLERIGGFGGKADLLNFYQTYAGDPGYLTQQLEHYRAVTADQVKAFANNYLQDAHRLVLDVEPVPRAAAGQAPGPSTGAK